MRMGRVGVDRLAGVADYSQKKLQALLDEAGVDRSRITRKEQLVEKVRKYVAADWGRFLDPHSHWSLAPR